MGLDQQENEGKEARSKAKKDSVASSKTKGGKKNVLSYKGMAAIADLPELPRIDSELEEDRGQIKEAGKTFSQLFEESSKGTNFKMGVVVEGTIVAIDEDIVTVDIGYKSEGQVRANEFLDKEGKLGVEPGDVVLVYIEKVEDDHGRLVLSKEKADVLRAWDEISEACDRDELVEGTVVAKVKGGLAVDIGVKAFLPGSQVDLRPTKNLDQYIGKTFKFKIIKFNKKRGNIVLSRRQLLMEERARLKEQTLSKLEEGMVIEGMIKNLTEYGAFIDLGGLDGLLHITDMSWGRIKHPNELFKVADTVQVKILKYDEDKERVSLGYKQLQPDPWNTVEDRFVVGTKVSGKTVSLTDYGAFIELEPGVEGLVHVSEMSWTQRVKHPSKLVNEGDTVEAIVLGVDKGNRRISLGMKQVNPNPWDLIAEKYPIGSKLKGTIKNTTDFGIFVGVPEGIDGLIHISDISWDSKDVDPNTMFKKGDEVECLVLSIDKDQEKFSLGIKQLSNDPWAAVAEKYKQGTKVTGKVIKATDFGVFLQLEEGVEALVHGSELMGDGKPKDRIEEAQKKGELEVVITSVDLKDRKLAASVRALERAEERANLKAYAEKSKEGTAASLGDLMGGEMAEKLKAAAAAAADTAPEEKKEEAPAEGDAEKSE